MPENNLKASVVDIAPQNQKIQSELDSLEQRKSELDSELSNLRAEQEELEKIVNLAAKDFITPSGNAELQEIDEEINRHLADENTTQESINVLTDQISIIQDTIKKQDKIIEDEGQKAKKLLETHKIAKNTLTEFNKSKNETIERRQEVKDLKEEFSQTNARLTRDIAHLKKLTKAKKFAEKNQSKYSERINNYNGEIVNLTDRNKTLNQEIKENDNPSILSASTRMAWKWIKNKVGRSQEVARNENHSDSNNPNEENVAEGEAENHDNNQDLVVENNTTFNLKAEWANYKKQRQLRSELANNKSRISKLRYKISRNQAAKENQQSIVNENNADIKEINENIKQYKKNLKTTHENILSAENNLKAASRAEKKAADELKNTPDSLKKAQANLEAAKVTIVSKIEELTNVSAKKNTLEQEHTECKGRYDKANKERKDFLEKYTAQAKREAATKKSQVTKNIKLTEESINKIESQIETKKTGTQNERRSRNDQAPSPTSDRKANINQRTSPAGAASKSLESASQASGINNKPPSNPMASQVKAPSVSSWTPRSCEIVSVGENSYEVQNIKGNALGEYSADKLAALDLMDHMVSLPRNEGQKIEITGGSDNQKELMLKRAYAHGLKASEVGIEGKNQEEINAFFDAYDSNKDLTAGIQADLVAVQAERNPAANPQQPPANRSLT